jgi:drug/metabolite transporter (DMT)-like permease
MSYAFVSLLGSLAFDHVWQALFFLGCGFILAEVVAVKKAQVAVLTPAPEPAATPVRRAAAFPRP